MENKGQLLNLEYYEKIKLIRQGKYLDIFIEDEDWRIRYNLAKIGYGLDILVNDEEAYVRIQVAKQGYRLDTLINDKYETVRQEVARQGYGLNQLIHDEYRLVEDTVKEYLKVHNLTLKQWIEKYPEKLSKKGILITLEGNDGCGKTTVLSLLKKHFKNLGTSDIVFTHEPGGTTIGQDIRSIFLNPSKSHIQPLTALFLLEAARYQHYQEIIKPALKMGKTVICDRFTDSTLVYQGIAEGLDIKTIKILNGLATENKEADICIYLQLDSAKRGLQRIQKKHRKKDRIDSKEILYHEKVKQGYDQLFSNKDNKRSKRIIVDANQTAEITMLNIVKALQFHNIPVFLKTAKKGTV